jgi:hypothetical protein
MDEGLKIRLGADIADFQKGLQQAAKDIQNFDAKTQLAIKGTVNSFKSLDQLGDRLKRLQDAQKKATDARSFAGLQKAIDVTKTRVDLLRNGFDAAGKSAGKLGTGGLVKGANQASFALTNLGRVASDLPFGFIAIQNNLDPLIQSFGQLKLSSGGSGAALKALGASLAGAGGLALAFSVISSAVTVAIQKYGSLGAAVDALIKSNDKLYKQRVLLEEVSKEANKNVGEEIARYKFLADTIANTALSDKVRADAIKKIREEYEPYLKNLTDEELLNGKLTTSINETVKALKAKALATAAVAKAGALSSQVLDALEKEEKLTASIAKLDAERVKLAGKIRIARGGSITGTGTDNDPAKENLRVANSLKLQREEIAKTRKEIEGQIDGLFGLAQTQNKLAQDGAIIATKQTAQLTAQEKAQKKLLDEKLKGYELELKSIERTFGATSSQYLNLARTIANTKAKISLIGEVDTNQIKEINQTLSNEIAEIASKLTAVEQEEQKKRLQFALSRYEKEADAIKKTSGSLSREFLDAQRKIATTKASIEIIVAIQNREGGKIADIKDTLNTELNNLESEFSQTRIIAGKIDFVPLLSYDEEGAKARFKAILASIKKTGFEEAAKTAGKVSGKVEIIPSAEVVANIGNFDLLNKKVAETAATFDQFFTPVINTAFEALGNGSSIFKAIGQSLKALVVQLGITIAKSLILAAILNSIAPGGFKLGGEAVKGFGNIFKSLLGVGGTAAPNFSGVAGGGLAISVGGQFNVRGTDLVAVVNQGNQRIGRVG